MNSRLKIAYVSADDPRDKKVWSGTHHNIYKSLQKIAEVDVLGPYEPAGALLFGKIGNQVNLKLRGKRVDYRHGLRLSKAYGKFFSAKLKEKKYDLIVAPAASAAIAFLETNVPVVYITDGTFDSCLNYHKALSNLTESSKNEGDEVERLAIKRSALTVVSSEWAAASVLQHYHLKKEKLKIISFGANFEKLPAQKDIPSEKPLVWKLLFVGVYWDTKGGEIAWNCFKILLEKGYSVELTVLGCTPPENFKHEKMKVTGFIDKNDPEGQNKLYDLFMQHHILILPTRFDCTPIVINEASAFGIPAVVAKTGGVEGHLKAGRNGYLADYEDQGATYGRIIEKLILNPNDYLALRKSSRLLYDEKLNWDAWIEEFAKGVKEITGKP